MVVPLAARLRPGLAYPATLAGVLASAGASAWALARVVQTEAPLHYDLGGWAPPVGIEYVVDHVSAFVALVVTGVSAPVVIATRRWAVREAGDRLGPFYGLVLLLLAGLTGIVVTGDLFNLFVFLEISSLSAYALVFQGGRHGMIAGFRYLVLGSIGGFFYLLGVGFLYFTTGTLNMAETAEILTDDASARSVQAGAVFIFVGLGLKMAVVPLHLWLPDAYTHAPSSVNTLLAPVMTKVGAYAMIRMFLSVFPDDYLTDVVPVADALIVLGLVGVVYGGAAAIGQQDIRRMLAYSSISQIGLIAAAIGLASPLGFIAALLHIMNHAVMKGALFIAAASVRYRTGESSVDGFTRLGRTMPLTMGAFTVAGLSMIGIPPTAGFFSKWWVAQAGTEMGAGAEQWAVVAVVLGSSMLTAAYVFRVLERAYLRPAQRESAGASVHTDAGGDGDSQAESSNEAAAGGGEAPLDMALPAAALAVATIVLGLLNTPIVTRVLEPGV